MIEMALGLLDRQQSQKSIHTYIGEDLETWEPLYAVDGDEK